MWQFFFPLLTCNSFQLIFFSHLFNLSIIVFCTLLICKYTKIQQAFFANTLGNTIFLVYFGSTFSCGYTTFIFSFSLGCNMFSFTHRQVYLAEGRLASPGSGLQHYLSKIWLGQGELMFTCYLSDAVVTLCFEMQKQWSGDNHESQ